MDKDLLLPDGRELTHSQLAELQRESRDYIKEMLERASIPCGRYASRAVNEAVRRMIAVIKADVGVLTTGFRMRDLSAKAQREIDMIMQDLIDKLTDHIFLYGEEAAENDEEKAMVLTILGEEFKGQTTRQRVEQQVAGVRKRLEHYLDDEVWDKADAERTDNWGFIENGAIAYISTRLLQLLAETEVSRAWQGAWQKRHEGATLVHVYRGSSYPCAYCDGEVSKGWQPADKALLPPFHRSCVCYTVFI